MKNLTDLDITPGLRVLVRVDANVSLGDNGIVDPFEAWRIDAILPTLTYLQEKKAKTIVVAHLGRDGATLKPVYDYMKQHIDLGFTPALQGEVVDTMMVSMGHGSTLLLENLRSNPGEEDNNESFSKMLASYADVYVNEAFSVSHREHASIVGIPRFLPGYAGLHLHKEYEELMNVRTCSEKLLLVVGGAKFGTKLPLIKKFAEEGHTIFVTGALAHPCMRARGMNIGRSLVDETANVDDIAQKDTVHLPSDVRLQTGEVVPSTDVGDHDVIVDAGPQTLIDFEEALKTHTYVLWNGPWGAYEDGHTEGTLAAAKLIARYNTHSVVGGGDTVTLLAEHDLLHRFNFVSTGGGAMLNFLTEGTLPGIEALSSHVV